MADKEKPLKWIGSAKKDLMALPTNVRIKVAEVLAKEVRNGKAHH